LRIVLVILLSLLSIPNLARASEKSQYPKLRNVILATNLDWSVRDGDEFLLGTVVDVSFGRDGTLFLLDSQLSDLKVFSSDGAYLRSIGRPGEAPGEFRRGVSIAVLSDGSVAVVQSSPARIVNLSADGRPLDDLHFEIGGDRFTYFNAIRSAGEYTIVASSGKSWEATRSLLSCSLQRVATGSEGTEIVTAENAEQSLVKLVWGWDHPRWFIKRWGVMADGIIAVAPSYDDYEVSFYSPGSAVRTVSFDYESPEKPPEVLESQMRQLRAAAKASPRSDDVEIRIRHRYRAVLKIIGQIDSCWILTADGYLEAHENAVGWFDDLTPNGDVNRRVAVEAPNLGALDLWFIVQDKLVIIRNGANARLDDNDDPELERYIEKMNLEDLETQTVEVYSIKL
jgi:6-bladed beta-propeller